jgi:hypothetical protein
MSNESDIQHGRHCVFKLHVHLVFVAKYRRCVFDAQAIHLLRGIFADVCSDAHATLVEMDGEDDHVHLPHPLADAQRSRELAITGNIRIQVAWCDSPMEPGRCLLCMNASVRLLAVPDLWKCHGCKTKIRVELIVMCHGNIAVAYRIRDGGKRTPIYATCRSGARARHQPRLEPVESTLECIRVPARRNDFHRPAALNQCLRYMGEMRTSGNAICGFNSSPADARPDVREHDRIWLERDGHPG